MALDFAALAEGVRKNNMGLGGFKLQARAAISAEGARLEPTGQLFELRGHPPDDGAPRWREFRVLEWGERSKGTLEAIEAPAPLGGEDAARRP